MHATTNTNTINITNIHSIFSFATFHYSQCTNYKNIYIDKYNELNNRSKSLCDTSRC